MSDDKITDLPEGVELGPGETLHPGGIIRRNGRIVRNVPALNPYTITKETSQRFHELRRESVIEAVYNGLNTGASTRDIGASVETVIAAQTRIALNEMAGRASTEAARFVFSAAGFLDRKPELTQAETAQIGRQFAAELCRLLQDNLDDVAETDIIDAEIVGNGNDNGGVDG